MRKTQRLSRQRVGEHRYWLLERGSAVVESILEEAPALAWYVERTQLVTVLDDGSGGTHLKQRQYLVRDYADTPTGSYLPSITAQARERLRELRMRHSAATNRTGQDL
ncbi:hypothetical protein ACFQV2_12785 [Actinokineospora soli]|uniref:Uncharacterized protein n=1 Tax=Actinokineospora soli TaxID=1048753 RepID=A0ABW2TN88_9PSEU